jgi:hypothetical protein
MSGPRGAHQGTTRLLSVTLVLLGVAMIVSTLARGGGPTAYGLLIGLLFVVAGGARLWLAVRLSQRDRS